MKIIKYSSPADIERIAKYMINVMSASRVFDDEGNYLNPESASGFPVFTINDVEYSMKASAAFIYYSDNVSKKTFGGISESGWLNEFVRLLTNAILSLETQYALNQIPWYNRYKTVFNSAQTCIKIKPTLQASEEPMGTKKSKKGKNNENKLIKNFTVVINSQYVPREKGVAKFTWHLMPSTNDDKIVGQYTKNESVLQRHVSSIFIDADDVIVLGDKEFVPLLMYEHFTAQTNTITAENITISPYGNPLLFYLNLEWRNACEVFKRIDYGKYKGSHMFRKLMTPVYEVAYDAQLFAGSNSEMLSCGNCRSMLFDDVYVLLGRKIPLLQRNGNEANEKGVENFTTDNNQKLMLCPLCLHLSLYPFECEYQYTLRTKIPVSVHDVIEFSVAPKPHKEALHVLAELKPIDINSFNDEGNILELGEHNKPQGYVIAATTSTQYRYNSNYDHHAIMRKSGYGGKKIIKVNFLP